MALSAVLLLRMIDELLCDWTAMMSFALMPDFFSLRISLLLFRLRSGLLSIV